MRSQAPSGKECWNRKQGVGLAKFTKLNREDLLSKVKSLVEMIEFIIDI